MESRMKHVTGQWPAQQRDYGPPLFENPQELHYAPDYGPHICATCWGAGWSKDQDGGLVRCERCAGELGKADNQRLGELWRLSGLNPHEADPPSLDRPFPPQAAMFAAARTFAAQPRGWLTLYGPWGSGKSHAAEAIARAMLTQRVPCLYMRSPDLFAYLGAAERNPNAFTDYEGRLYWMQRTRVLVIDEFGREKSTDTINRLRMQLLDFRYRKAIANEGGQTVFISNDPPDQWTDIAISSRVQDSRFVVIEAPSVDFRKVKR
jgi:DNA replication protein DnaC